MQGLSEITKDSAYPINFNAGDHYLLDGQKLIWVPAGTSGIVNAGYFHTERESFLRIACYDANNQKINSESGFYSAAYWIVTQKNGTKMYYGYTSQGHNTANDGRIDAIGKTSPRSRRL